jgi:DNA repair protein RecN (Recombination protein N)
MLSQLRIRDFAIIDDLSMEIGPGLNVLTGETGAGKSILVEALNLALGGRARADVIRGGAEEASVEALFEGDRRLVRRLAEMDIDAEGGLLVRRVVSRAGKNRITVNGSPMTLALLERIAEDLVDLTGQHEHHSLLRPDTHLAILDDLGNLGSEREAVAGTYAGLAALLEERAALEKDERERSAREDFLAFQVREIREAALRPGEEEALAVERARLRSAEKLHAATAGGEEALYGADLAAAAAVARVERELTDLGSIDPELGAYAEQLSAARLEIEDVARSLGRYARGIAADPQRQAEVEERLALLARLRRKYGSTVEEVIATGERLAAELERLEGAAERLQAIAREIDADQRTLETACRALTEGRQKAAKRLGKAVEIELATLALSGARLVARVEPRPPSDEGIAVAGARAGPRGADRVEILFAPNRGEEARALARIASGGELARVTLAVKMVLCANDPIGTYVFDEVDAGIGGAVGEVVGRKLREVSRERQVLCVTHLPQIAAFADRHFRVSKRVSGGRTVCEVDLLTEEDRKLEIARMLGGLKITEKTRAHAEEMIRAAR